MKAYIPTNHNQKTQILMGNDENLIITTAKQHYDIKTATFNKFLSSILTRAFIPE